ncbi:MAG: YHS domain-containing protein [Ignavibacteriae bacterium]|nr:YHS domain-containing protein [Ignavibacteriota bacterium]
MTRDVVCGMQIELAMAAGKSAFNGQIYFFCAPGCKKAFDKDPERFVREDGRSVNAALRVSPGNCAIGGTPEDRHVPHSGTIINNTSLRRAPCISSRS